MEIIEIAIIALMGALIIMGAFLAGKKAGDNEQYSEIQASLDRANVSLQAKIDRVTAYEAAVDEVERILEHGPIGHHYPGNRMGVEGRKLLEIASICEMARARAKEGKAS